MRPWPPTLRSLTLTSGLSATPNRCVLLLKIPLRQLLKVSLKHEFPIRISNFNSMKSSIKII